MKMHLLAPGLLAVAPLVAANAQDNPRQFAVEGAGMLTCERFIAARGDTTSPDYQRMIGFIEGYLSAANLYEPDTFDLTPWHNAAALDLIVENHCAQHPEDRLVGVTQRMVGGLRPYRIARFSQMLEVGDGQNRAFVYETILRRAQAALQLRGLYSGAEDGTYTPALRDAFRDFQRSVRLNETGVPDPATLWKLLNP
ncbi:peptidoglycan-binding domain-containing protein [Erythrobacter sanguineus]|uniref:Putative peptidoglycan binding domain-containing protein n=1 Tax=Erythrobacter sanguineus TaxID=198312 RepID=A0A1M7S1A4_9SPHN|nr:peptidoglycan-binding domain-containing protein [Erythrobacter sanguineus]SHN52377.1 Putative peptidoglycan binding domain-containing protein [Erythrobacter sanguineus]